MNLHKYQHLSIENASECLEKVIEIDKGKKDGIRQFLI